MRVLGIETSCDETGVAVYDTGLSGAAGLRAHAVYSQIALHAEYGGVVPELASRDHVRKLLPLVRQTLAEAGLTTADIDGVAYTAGPGLVGALLVGAGVARSLAWALEVPAVGVHHMEGHLLAPLMEDDPPEAPFVALLVSGGHTQLVAVDAIGRYRLLGETLDDAAGEAFDKTAKMMGLPYPGGPQLAALAEQGTPGRFRFARPMTDRPGLDFSFSGLKTRCCWPGATATRPNRLGRTSHAGSRMRWSTRWRSSASARWMKLAATSSSLPAAWAPTSGCARSCRRWRPSVAAVPASRGRRYAPTTAR